MSETTEEWSAAADDLRARAIAEPGRFEPGKIGQTDKDVKFHEATILGWSLKARATEAGGAKGSGRLWMLSGVRQDEPDAHCINRTRDLIVRLGAPELFSRPISRGRDPSGNVAWTWGWLETTSVRAEPDAAPKGRVGRNETCPCGSGVKFKRCCGGSAS